MEPAADADPRGKRDPRDFALWKGSQGGRARDGGVAVAVGPRPAGLAPRVLGDGGQVPRRRVRHPRRRPRPALPAPRERAGPVPRGRPAVRPVLDAQRDGQPRRREDEQVGRQLAARVARSSSRSGRSSCATTSSPRTTARSSSSPMSRCRGGVRLPAHRGLRHAGPPRSSATSSAPACSAPSSPRRWTTTCPCRRRSPSCTASIREGNKLRRSTGRRDALRGNLAAVRAMLDVLGLDPLAATWATAGGGVRPAAVIDASSRGAASSAPRRARARTSPPPTRIRDQLHRRGHRGRGHPPRPRWTLAEESLMAGQQQPGAARSATAGSKKGADRRLGRPATQGPAGQGPDAEGDRARPAIPRRSARRRRSGPRASAATSATRPSSRAASPRSRGTDDAPESVSRAQPGRRGAARQGARPPRSTSPSASTATTGSASRSSWPASARHPGARGAARRARPDDRRPAVAPGPRAAGAAVRVRPPRRLRSTRRRGRPAAAAWSRSTA